MSLAKEIRAGNSKAFDKLYRAYYQRLTLYTFRMLKDLDASEDIVQSIIVKLWEKRETLDFHEDLDAYLFKAAKNSALNHLRHKKVRQEHKDVILFENEYLDHGFDLAAVEMANHIQQKIDSLGDPQGKIFLMSREEDKSYKEIADELNMSVKNVEYYISKTLKILRVFTKKYMALLLIYLGEGLGFFNY